MRRYREWRLSSFDQYGIGLPDRQQWYVGPVVLTAGCSGQTEADWDTMLWWLDGADGWEVHRLRHWWYGSVSVVLVRPDSPALALLGRLTESAILVGAG